MVFRIYTALVTGWLLIFLLTFRYRKNRWKAASEKKGAAGCFWGMSAFLLEMTDRYLFRINYEKKRNDLSVLKIRRVGEHETYIHVLSTLAVALLAGTGMLVLGYGKCAVDYFGGEKQVVSLKRGENGEGSKIYHLVAEYDGRRKNLEVTIGEKSLDEEKARERLDACEKKLLQEMLAKNKSSECVTQDLYFPIEMEDDILVSWEVEDPDVIDETGKILWENLDQRKTTGVKAVMSLGGYSLECVYPLTLEPAARDVFQLVTDQIAVRDKDVNLYRDQVDLEEIGGSYHVKLLESAGSNGGIYLILTVMVSVLVYLSRKNQTEKMLKMRREQLESDYALIVSKLTVLQGAGMTMLGAWDKILEDYEAKPGKEKRFVFEEMKYARQKMRMGMAETDAYLEFGRRCGTHSYIKLANLLEQNIRKGTKGLKEMLQNEVVEAFEERKALARKRGDEAGTKLLIPMIMMLIISIAVIVIPAILAFQI